MSDSGTNPFVGSAPTPTGLLVWAAALTLLAVSAAMWRFSRRDL